MASRSTHADHFEDTRSALRQRPEMASLKLLVLKFVQQYIAEWKGSPSLGEIASALATNRTRVRRAIRRLELDGQLVRVPGPRGLSLPDDEPPGRSHRNSAGQRGEKRYKSAPAAACGTGLCSPTIQYAGNDHSWRNRGRAGARRQRAALTPL